MASLLNKLWLSLLRLSHRRSTNARLWFKRRICETRRITLLGNQLTEDQMEKLGELVSTSYWPAIRAYIQIERDAAINNGLVQAQDMLQLGQVQGDIGRCNKIEVDFMQAHSIYLDRHDSKPKKDGLANATEDGQDSGQ